MKDAVATMGTLLPDDVGGRDAVHVAVVSAMASVKLSPGDDVGYEAAGALAVKSEPHIGIVDPFLTKAVPQGSRFWLYLYPRTITGLKHLWTHPAFPEEAGADAPNTAEALTASNVYARPGEALAAEQWLRQYADSIDVGFKDLINSTYDFLKYGEYMVRGGLLEGISTPPEFWVHYEKYSGKEVPEDRKENFFSCSC